MLFRNRLARNPYFHWHPMHSAFSLVAGLILLGLMTLFLTTTAR